MGANEMNLQQWYDSMTPEQQMAADRGASTLDVKRDMGKRTRKRNRVVDRSNASCAKPKPQTFTRKQRFWTSD